MDELYVRRAGALLFVGAAQFAFFFALAEIYYPGYSVSADYISDLGATCTTAGRCSIFQPSATIFDISVAVLGLLGLAVAYCLSRAFGSRVLTLFTVLWGIGAIGVGTFNETFGVVHTLFSALTFFATGVFSILMYRRAKPPMNLFVLLAGVVTLAALVLYATHDYLGLGGGGMERMIVYPVMLAGMGLGGYFIGVKDSGGY